MAQKNITDLIVAWSTFGAVGFAFVFGPSWQLGGLVLPLGAPGWAWTPLEHGVFFVFHGGFCAAAITIVSGAVAERIRFQVYALVATLLAVVLYPVFARLVWGNLLGFEGQAALADLGFIDVAGATVVHGIGGWSALAACLVIGRRVDVPRGAHVHGHSDVLTLFGASLLIVGWLGFNAGAEVPGTAGFANAFVGTLLASAAGGAIGMGLGIVLDRGITRPGRSVAGVLGGLVAVTACASLIDRDTAMAIGALGALAATVAGELLDRLGVDDPLDAVAVHGVAGAVGTLAVPFAVAPELLVEGSMLAQLKVQAIGVVVAFALAFGGVFTFLQVLQRFVPLRVTEAQERMGLNVSEHGALLGVERLRRAIDEQQPDAFAAGTTRLRPLPSNGDDGSDIADAVNGLLMRYEDVRADLEAAQARLGHFADSASDFLWETDQHHTLMFVSARFVDLFDKPVTSVLGRSVFDAFQIRRAEAALIKLKTDANERFEAIVGCIVDGAGDKRVLRLRGSAFYDATGRLAGIRGAAEDATEEMRNQERLRRLAHHDPLTGLFNRRRIHETLEELAAAPAGTPAFATVAFDLDGFKLVNDTFGHETGDKLLGAVADRMSTLTRHDDALARCGGDEFVAVLPWLDDETAEAFAVRWAQRVIDAISEPYDVDGIAISVGSSAGVCIAKAGDVDVNEVLLEADRALYHAKRSGRGHAVAYDDAIGKADEERRELERDMRIGLEQGHFFIEYQPQCCSATGAILGFEALLRWRHPRIGMISPTVFIPIAEQSTLIQRLGEFALFEAMTAAADWAGVDPAFEDVMISINISPAQLRLESFVASVVDALEHAGVAPERLEIELTEGVFLKDTDNAVRKLRDLRRQGVSIAIDDFGTGFSSLSYLKHLPLNRLKIDRSFVSDIADDENSMALADTIIRLSQSLGLSVIAEGVETEEQKVRLSELGCPMFQGFLRSRPVSADEAVAMLHAELARGGPRFDVASPAAPPTHALNATLIDG